MTSHVVWYHSVASLVILAGTTSCGRAGAAARWEAQVDTIGDTIVVRTLSGSIWQDTATLVPDVQIGQLEGDDEYLLGDISGLSVGLQGEMYVYDRQVPVLRQYDRDGKFVMTIGRQGGGPGEYKGSDGAIAILEDGRIVLRDPGNARFQLWTPDGQPAGEWRHIGGFFTSTPMFVDTAGIAYSSSVNFGAPPPYKASLARFSPNGVPLDTIPVPDWGYEAPQIKAQRLEDGKPTSTMISSVPFSPTQQWTLSPLGYFVGGISDRYAITLFRPEGPLRIERVTQPVPVDPAEKANAEEVAAANMRRMVSDWKWNGPGIPDTKPPFSNIRVSQEGRIWVQIAQPGERIPDDEIDEPEPRPDGVRPPVRRWREPVAFDVFEPDGRFVGRVRAPTGFSMNPAPVIRGDTVWAIVRDALGVQRLTRFHVQFPMDT